MLTTRARAELYDAKIAALFLNGHELQTFTGMINQNLKGGGFKKDKFDFTYKFDKPPAL